MSTTGGGQILRAATLLALAAVPACVPPSRGGNGPSQNSTNTNTANTNAPANQNGNGANANSPGNANDNGAPAAQWQLVFDELAASFLSVSGTASDDVYAVGADPGDGGGPYVFHYDGQRWQRLQTELSGDLWWISDRLISGAFYLAGEGGLIIRFDPVAVTFEREDTPGTETLFGVWGTDAGPQWAVGGDLATQASGGVIWRFAGAQWVVEDIRSLGTPDVPLVFKVWGRSATEVYVVGFSGLTARFDGDAWTRLENELSGDPPLFTIHGDDMQVVGVGGSNPGIILELDGDAFRDRAPAGALGVNGVFIPAGQRGVAVGRDASVLFQTDDGWEIQQTGFNTIRSFHAVWVDPAGGIWAVGGNIDTDPPSGGILAHYGTEPISDEIVP